MSQKPEDDRIPLSARYSSAWNELNQRITARQVSYIGHTAACAAIAKILADKITALAPGSEQAPNAPRGSIYQDIAWILCPAIVGLAFGCWIRTQDLTIGLLDMFCRFCEERNYEAKNPLPAWHSNYQDWAHSSMNQREWMEMAFTFLNFSLAELANWYCIRAWGWCNSIALVAVNHLMLGLSSWMVMSIQDFRGRLKEIKPAHSGKFKPPLPSPHPWNLMAIVVVLAATCASLGWLIVSKFPPAKQLNVAVISTWSVAVSSRVLAVTFDLLYRKRSQLSTPSFWSAFWSAHWLVPVAMAITSIILLAQPIQAHLPRGPQFALFISMILVGYGIPEFVFCLNRFRSSSLGPDN